MRWHNPNWALEPADSRYDDDFDLEAMERAEDDYYEAREEARRIEEWLAADHQN